MTQLAFDPLLPWAFVAAIGLLAALTLLWSVWRGLRGWMWRGLAIGAAALALSGPVLQSGTRLPLSDIVILLEDRSANQSLSGRGVQTDHAIRDLTRQIEALPNTELRHITLGDDEGGTLLGQALTRAIAAEPESRIAGVIAVTDGQGHDPAMVPASAPTPVHLLLTGQPDDWDRRLVIEEAPAFALVGQPVMIRVRIEDQGQVPAALARGVADLHIAVDGASVQTLAVPINQTVDLEFVPEHAGQNVVAISFDSPQTEPAELTERNNAAAVQIQGVRDRLRVLLVSGEPHAGERTWRNLLKSDTNVDLIHFTILRSPENMDMVPIDELSLIAFPTRELFMERVQDFDLIIFDRYAVRGILPPEYFENIARYVENGGALLVAAGPEMASVQSLNLSPLGRILPAHPTGHMYQLPFLPRLTDEGQRHPVTADLPGAPDDDGDGAAHWGRWLRMAQSFAMPGAQVVMSGAEDQPLLVLNRVGQGRVALLASDQVWLWDRGFEGGGPQRELLRRIAHWSMKEPELEEETLLASVRRNLEVVITRRTMQDSPPPLRITGPGDQTRELTLEPAGPGRFSTTWAAPGPGVYRLDNGDVTRVVALGPAAPREFERTLASADVIGPLVQATQGAVMPLSDGMPALRLVRTGRPAAGSNVAGDWIGITPRDSATVAGRTHRPLLPGWGWLLLVAGLALAAWLREGRRGEGLRGKGRRGGPRDHQGEPGGSG